MKNAAEMPFLDHLEELRWRIIWSLAALVVGVVIGFVIVFNFDVLTWLQGPILPFLNGTKLFELPIVILLLSVFGIVTPHFLAKFRRHAIVGSYVAASFITPGDLVISSIALTVPLYLLYELSIALSFLVYRAKQRKRLADEAGDALA